jgi:hypothetical protein
MMGGRNGRDAAARFAERRRLEDEAPRLHAVVPTLTACKIEIAEGREHATTAEITYTKRVIIAVAPALFMFPCGDAACRDGGHDITNELVRGLREGKTEIRGQDTCFGHTGTADCGRVLRFAAFAEYAASTPP